MHMLEDLEKFIRSLEEGWLPLSTPEMDELARQALASIKARENEDIEEWARRLIESCGD